MRVDDPTLSIVAMRRRAGQPFRRQGLNDFPAAFELVDIGDEFEDFRGDRDVLDLVHGCNIQFHPFISVPYPMYRHSRNQT